MLDHSGDMLRKDGDRSTSPGVPLVVEGPSELGSSAVSSRHPRRPRSQLVVTGTAIYDE